MHIPHGITEWFGSGGIFRIIQKTSPRKEPRSSRKHHSGRSQAHPLLLSTASLSFHLSLCIPLLPPLRILLLLHHLLPPPWDLRESPSLTSAFSNSCSRLISVSLKHQFQCPIENVRFLCWSLLGAAAQGVSSCFFEQRNPLQDPPALLDLCIPG